MIDVDVQRGAGGPAERSMERDADELEDRLERLGGDIDEAKHELEARREDADVGEDVGGDWEDTDDATGGEDPAAFDDPEETEADEEE